MKEFRVVYWCEDGSEDYLEFDTMELAQNFYDSLDGQATIQKWFPEFGAYVDIWYQEFEY